MPVEHVMERDLENTFYFQQSLKFVSLTCVNLKSVKKWFMNELLGLIETTTVKICYVSECIKSKYELSDK